MWDGHIEQVIIAKRHIEPAPENTQPIHTAP